MDFSNSLFLWTLINFVVLLFVLHRFAWGPFYKMVLDNETQKNEALSELEARLAESKRLADDYQARLNSLNAETQAIRDKALAEQEQLKKEETAKMLEERRRMIASTQEMLAHEKEAMITQVRSVLMDVTSDAVRKILNREISLTSHEDIVNQQIQELGTKLR